MYKRIAIIVRNPVDKQAADLLAQDDPWKGWRCTGSPTEQGHMGDWCCPNCCLTPLGHLLERAMKGASR